MAKKIFTVEQRLLKRTVKETEVTSPHVNTPCWVCNYALCRGYPRIWVDEVDHELKRTSESRNAHRIAYSIFVGNIPDGLFVLHKCDNMRCVNPEHLFLGSTQDNVDDRNNKNRQSRGESHSAVMREVAVRGERHPLAKLTEEDVRYIRMWYVEGFTQEKIAAAFNVAHQTIGRIANRKIWKHIL